MLFDPHRHERLQEKPWNSGEMESAVSSILLELDASLHDGFLSLSGDRPGHDGLASLSLYGGALGTAWSLLRLSEQTGLSLSANYREMLEPTYEHQLSRLADQDVHLGYLHGKLGQLAVLCCFDETSSRIDEFLQVSRAVIERPENELMWAAPGALLAASLLYQRTGRKELVPIIDLAIRRVFNEWKVSDESPTAIWTQVLYGKSYQLLGAAHGFAGNILSLLSAFRFLSEPQRGELIKRASETLHGSVSRDNGRVNWIQSLTFKQPNKFLLQWCHGAPGLLTCFRAFPTNEVDSLLLEAGHTVWAAGPLTKTHGFCHGNAGNGYAFLSLFERTGDEEWLDRAKAFAVHSLWQSNRAFERSGQRQLGLYDGDSGLCWFLMSCLRAEAKMPSLDFL
ncbi:MAG: LanC-like protein [Bdellovibrionaceae bacterium]|nr:LanC-like protein [Pseudobdellovibrionaceae bacterium]